MFTLSLLRVLFTVAIIAAPASACGGSSNQPPPETPPTEPGATAGDEAASEGEHTMPDGTTMPGHHHGDSAEQPEEE